MSTLPKTASRKFIWIIPILALAGLAGGLFLNRLFGSALVANANSLPDYGAVSDFTLIEKSGSNLSLSDFKGKPWIANFMFTSCASLCPMMNLEVSRLQKSLPSNIKIVSFSVDPERDNPQVLSRYAENYQAEKNRWLFLTGEREVINKVVQSFHVNTIEDPNFHSVRLVLMDGNARIRGYYDSTSKEAIHNLVRDAQILIHGDH